MTTFEITIIVLLAAIVMLLAWHCTLTRNNYSLNQTKELKRQQDFEKIFRQIGSIELIAVNSQRILKEFTDIVDKMHRNICVEIADKMMNKMYPVNEGEPLDAAFEPDYKLKKDIECKLNGFAAAVLDAECCTEEIVDFWLERICDAAYKYIKQLKIDWDKLSKEQQDEFLKRIIMPNYDSPFQPPFNPTCEITNKKE